jgi:hypothetical protein
LLLIKLSNLEPYTNLLRGLIEELYATIEDVDDFRPSRLITIDRLERGEGLDVSGADVDYASKELYCAREVVEVVSTENASLMQVTNLILSMMVVSGAVGSL